MTLVLCCGGGGGGGDVYGMKGGAGVGRMLYGVRNVDEYRGGVAGGGVIWTWEVVREWKEE